MTKKHYLRNRSVVVYGLILDVEYYWTPSTRPTNDHPGDDSEVEFNKIEWTNNAGETQDITDLILEFDRALTGKLHKAKEVDKVSSIINDIIQSIEKLEQS